MFRVKTYLRKNGLLPTLEGIKHKQMINLFAQKHNLSVVGKPRTWIVDLYNSGNCGDCCRLDSYFYSSPEWKQLRVKVLDYYGGCCMKCKNTTESPHVDHIKPRSLFPELELEFSNLQVLCQVCNISKSNRNTIDYRPKILNTEHNLSVVLSV